MRTFEELLSPIPTSRFLADHDGRMPLHIPAQGDDRKREALTWAAFNALLNQTGLWTAQTLRLMRDHVPVPTDQYCASQMTANGPVVRPVPGKVEACLADGASLVANETMALHPPLAAIGAMLSETFAAQVGANIYCSFQGVRAFGTHFDNHDVLVIHTEGQKIWNLYANRAVNPIENLPVSDATRRWCEETRGPLMAEITMRPGDVLYLPRGWYHDALASGEASLHVTFSINPLYGRTLLTLLDNAAMQNSAFRAWLPPAAEDGGDALRRRLVELGRFLGAVVSSPAFFDEVAMTQQRLVPKVAAFALPERRPPTLYQATGQAFPPASTGMAVAFDWARDQKRFSIEDLIATVDFLSETEIRAGVLAAVEAGALRRL